MGMSSFDEFFCRLTGHRRHEWQDRLASDPLWRDRLIRIPTGFGKTAGVTLAWLWNRVHRKDGAWPRRLVLCLPMRTLVEQAEREVAGWLERAGLDPGRHVHTLLGGLSPSDWHLEPERECVLIGTQDMLLSRALNRGYGAGRARWPMEYGLLNVDCLWVMDEIQLMGVGLATSAQLQGPACHDKEGGKLPRPRSTWWMSATLQRDWLRRAPSLHDVDSLPLIRLERSEQTGHLWTVEKTIRRHSLPMASDRMAEAWADIVAQIHSTTNRGVTLVVVNKVVSAVALHTALGRRLAGADLRLVHSRFRGEERKAWTKEFLAREHCAPGKHRVIVATQVVEAGVDISADALVTEIAPWASLVQRFGRCARYGGVGRIVVVDRRHSDESARAIKAKDDVERAEKRHDADRSTVLPYDLAEIEASAEAITLLGSAAGPAALEAFEEAQAARRDESLLPRLYPYAPLHVLTRRDLHDLFDTSPDLSGADIDISRFVREGEERDVTVWWWPVPEGQFPHRRLRPSHDALCRIPVDEARKWLLGRGGVEDDDAPAAEEAKGRSRKLSPRAWVWSYLDGAWEQLDGRHIYPGQTILVDAAAGGYDATIGFTGRAGEVSVHAGHARASGAADAADAADEQDELSEGIGGASRQYKTIATHGAETAAEARAIGQAMDLEGEALALEHAGLVHDIGKAHPAFVAAIRDRNGIAGDVPLAKAPKGRWWNLHELFNHSRLGRRPGFRHELASALALLELAWRARADHPALQGRHKDVLELTVGHEVPGDEVIDATGFVGRFVNLDEIAFNLLLYLVMSHHGKVRATLAMSPRDQASLVCGETAPIRGICDGDVLPFLVLADTDGHEWELPRLALHLDPARVGLSRRYGPSWVERVLAVRERYGDFQLAWLEALLRVADVRASRIASPFDSRLPPDLVAVPAMLEAEDREAQLRKWIEKTLTVTTQGEASSFRTKSTRRRSSAVGGVGRPEPIGGAV
jgi:CRISPR-associated endonuclease/helicase Cas3